MATALGETATAGERAADIETFIDRWIYVLMAALFVAVALVGFIPSSLGKMAAVAAGTRPPFPPLLHLHAVLMGSWLLLLFAQAWLMASGQRRMHRQLGIAGMMLAVAVVVVGALLVSSGYAGFGRLVAAPPPGVDTTMLAREFDLVTNLMFGQVKTGIAFAILIAIALLARRRDPGLHKRMVVLATAVPLPAATERMSGWLPSTVPDSPLSLDLYMLALIAPLLAWDLVHTRRLHRAYLIWFAVNVPLATAHFVLWNSPAWLGFAQGLVRAGG